jgi:co-chaperonin GroES (HSP10)
MIAIPLNGYIIVEIDKEKVSPISTPKDAEASIQDGKVVTVPDDIQQRTGLKVGDIVRWIKFAEKEGKFELDGKQLTAVHSDNIMIIFRSK